MTLSPNLFKQRLSKGTPQIGLWNSFRGSDAAEIVAHAGYDWVVLDMEHAPNDIQSVFGLLQTYAGNATQTIVRVPWNDTVMVKRLLDIGARSILFPMVQTVEEAKTAVAATRYPPEGRRGVAGATRASKYGRVKDYFSQANDGIGVVVQLETLSALDKAEEIASVEGVDAVFFGPSDIAADMGLLGQPGHPDVWAKIHEAADKVRAANGRVGTLVLDGSDGAALLNKGYHFCAVGLDTILLARAADALLAKVKDGLSS